MEDTLFCGNREPTLEQILAEPIVQLVLRGDGIDERTIRELMRKAARAEPPRRVRLDLVPPAPPPINGSELSQASIGVLAQAAVELRWPRVFPSL